MAKNRLSFQANLSRHSHDLSAGYTSTIAPGMIIPQWFDIAQPGDTYYLQSAFKARLQDIIRAFYGEIDVHLDYFFVPLQMLYTPFGQVFAQTDDLISSLFSTFDPTRLDSFPLLNISQSLLSYSSNSAVITGHNECVGKEYARLFDSLDYNPLCVCTSSRQTNPESPVIDLAYTNAPNVSPWLFAAYQCIYQKYFRNDEFERLSVESYNFDSKYTSSNFRSSSLISLRYVQRPADYFTSIRVSPIASGVNSFGSASSDDLNAGGRLSQQLLKVNSFLTPRESDVMEYNGDETRIDEGSSSSLSFFSSSVQERSQYTDMSQYSYLNAANIRALFAVDKFARIWGRADKTYDDQILAHFGIEIPHDVKHDITHIKHYHAALGATPVYGTATTVYQDSGNNSILGTIGEVGGQGDVLLNTGEDKFTTPVHGVIMCVAYVVTKPRYLHTFSKLHCLKDRLAFPIPEFDKLGAQPMYMWECHPWYLMDGVRIGWQNRYAQFKQKYDRASITFTNQMYRRAEPNANVYAPWVIARPAFNDLPTGTEQDSHMMDASMFFETPHALDSIMAVQFDGGWSDSYGNKPHMMFQTDPLITEFYMRCKKVSWMSETGEPDL